jgi:hypothetical protein
MCVDRLDASFNKYRWYERRSTTRDRPARPACFHVDPIRASATSSFSDVNRSAIDSGVVQIRPLALGVVPPPNYLAHHIPLLGTSSEEPAIFLRRI